VAGPLGSIDTDSCHLLYSRATAVGAAGAASRNQCRITEPDFKLFGHSDCLGGRAQSLFRRNSRSNQGQCSRGMQLTGSGFKLAAALPVAWSGGPRQRPSGCLNPMLRFGVSAVTVSLVTVSRAVTVSISLC
jgi:hypothetical protein